MKLSELAAYRDALIEHKTHDSVPILTKEMDAAMYFVGNKLSNIPNNLRNLQNLRDQALQSVRAFDQTLDDILRDIGQQIKNLEPTYLARSYTLYDEGLKFDSPDYILDRRLPITAEVQSYIQSRIQYHSDYHHTAMTIRPGREDWIQHMVACDPLYIVDTDHELFNPTKNKFNALYQSRLRYYAIQESSDQLMMSMLPDDQFGFVLAYNFFHYKPFGIMRAYLKEIYDKLRPGGVLCMTFTNCDRRGAIELAERMMNCYTPGRLIIGACESIGFEICLNYEINAAVDWVEIRKPGKRPSLRGGQTLAKLVAKSK